MNEPEARVAAATIRAAVREDCRGIAALFAIGSEGLAEHLWIAIAQPGEDPTDAGARRCLRTGVAFSFENCLIADRAGAAIGLLHLLAMDEAASAAEPVDPALRPFFALRDVGSLYISALIVEPGYRGRGLGTRLLDRAEQQARLMRVPRLSLVVLQHNKRAMRFYRRAGFREVNRRALAPPRGPALDRRRGPAGQGCPPTEEMALSAGDDRKWQTLALR